MPAAAPSHIPACEGLCPHPLLPELPDFETFPAQRAHPDWGSGQSPAQRAALEGGPALSQFLLLGSSERMAQPRGHLGSFFGGLWFQKVKSPWAAWGQPSVPVTPELPKASDLDLSTAPVGSTQPNFPST